MVLAPHEEEDAETNQAEQSWRLLGARTSTVFSESNLPTPPTALPTMSPIGVDDPEAGAEPGLAVELVAAGTPAPSGPLVKDDNLVDVVDSEDEDSVVKVRRLEERDVVGLLAPKALK